MQEALSTEVLEQRATRLLVASPVGRSSMDDSLPAIHALVSRSLDAYGGILLRGFDKLAPAGFNALAASFGRQLLRYEFASTPRTKIEAAVYSSTEYPAHQWIDQHNEQSYTREWPRYIWFFCDRSAKEGGATPVADSREVYRRLSPDIRERFARKQVRYVRNYGNGLDVPWQQVFGTEARDAVEAFCRQRSIQYEWRGDDGLRTWQVCQSETAHPLTQETVWFNQAHLFHVSGLPPAVRDALLAVVDEDELPRNAYYGDGSPIEADVLDEIRAVYQESMLSFPWREGDVMMLDNVLMSHGRAPFTGERRVLVAMSG
ncbi:TauD/TfdA family dioxygenase [Paraburkholderia caballeronis]|uniref:TauD/TfdA family dioxygenase n=1 Tax=Paraburkholderia caballeronis TaxID=416943 RepID=UPI0010670917|nr:TauD/TfdA family dioxygenase [Paraburkholderia caballeronis]TDV04347.1 alpha-ketoglutarate-dependent taurine dioxygenase [Paraburkholderia caballeronis]TDV17705.1 alpha-ketoglutarate-dependent taurine dioxygenase [Paraburkholderia caballeronis]TDV18735.1 alpha-ketoglutarate-dependent taurine dioxygenase [Paraburkholderia caballeronis]